MKELEYNIETMGPKDPPEDEEDETSNDESPDDDDAPDIVDLGKKYPSPDKKYGKD